jgi:hypothetical protein
MIKLKMFFNDSAEAWQLGFQDPASPVMDEIIKFHHGVMIYLMFILVAVL